MPGQIQTVLGRIAPENLGRTLTHEHFSLDFEKFYVEPPVNLKSYIEGEIKLDNIGLIRQYPYSSHDNLAFYDDRTHAAIKREMEIYKKLGGGAVVENTSHGIKRDLKLMCEVSCTTGVHVIAGTGYYVSSVQPPSVLRMSREDMCQLMYSELCHGCDDVVDVKCGFIGEVGSGWPLHEFEVRVIKAVAEVQSQLNCPVSFHPGRNPQAPFEIMRLFQEAGGKASKTVMSHLDRTLPQKDTLLEFAAMGSYCQFDLFGTECSQYQLDPSTDMPSDAQRMDRVLSLLADGRHDKILLSHDIHTKHRLMQFGGHGFSHILTNILHRLKAKGVDQATVDQISIINPANWLAWELD
ncbi:phosphotriesterase-related protein [Anabrus simplex]|uniref:phosphotriesterase-related protein n=1 Tax=Anabrus simplex TaxID=316456 RepID=UPI0035A32BF8